MSGCIVLVPTVLMCPAFFPAVAMAGAALGLSLVQELSENIEQTTNNPNVTSVEVDLPKNYALAETIDEGEKTVLEGKGFKVIFKKTGRGDVVMCVEGEGKTTKELEKLGRDLLNRIAQQYVYQKVTKELKKRGFTIAQEQVENDQTIRLIFHK